MASVKATSRVRELHESVAKDLGIFFFQKDAHRIAVLEHDILSHFLLGSYGL